MSKRKTPTNKESQDLASLLTAAENSSSVTKSSNNIQQADATRIDDIGIPDNQVITDIVDIGAITIENGESSIDKS